MEKHNTLVLEAQLEVSVAMKLSHSEELNTSKNQCHVLDRQMKTLANINPNADDDHME